LGGEFFQGLTLFSGIDRAYQFGRYLLYGDICAKAGYALKQPEVETFFTRLIQRVSPKSYAQALGEVTVTQKFLENFSGDQVWLL
jgi:1-pyrroline-5-carboxylate dehydrogenase